MEIHVSQLLHWMVHQIGDQAHQMPIQDVMIEKHSGVMVALKCNDQMAAIHQDVVLSKGAILLDTPVREYMDNHKMAFDHKKIGVTNLLGKNVLDSRYQLIGIVGDLIFDLQLKKWIAIELSQGVFKDLLIGREKIYFHQIQSIKQNRIVVKYERE